MIQYTPRMKARNREALERLREMAAKGSADAALRTLQRHAEALLADMQKIHGGRWSIDINHRSCFVLVARDGD